MHEVGDVQDEVDEVGGVPDDLVEGDGQDEVDEGEACQDAAFDRFHEQEVETSVFETYKTGF